EDGIRDRNVTGVQTCALPISTWWRPSASPAGRVHACGRPAPLTLYLVLALWLWRNLSYKEVWRRLSDRGAFTGLAPGLPVPASGAFWRGYHLSAVDGTCLDVCDTSTNRKVRWPHRRGLPPDPPSGPRRDRHTRTDRRLLRGLCQQRKDPKPTVWPAVLLVFVPLAVR